jgi:hypothetical protein
MSPVFTPPANLKGLYMKDLKGYLVLSVSDLRNMLKVAREQAHKEGYRGRASGKWCLVLSDITLSDVGTSEDGELQISSYDIAYRVRAIRKAGK